jgi:hypothetical protein
MTPTTFREANMVIAKNQSDYLPLPAQADRTDPKGVVTSCWKASLLERLIFLFTGRMWLKQMRFTSALQPQYLCLRRRDFMRKIT